MVDFVQNTLDGFFIGSSYALLAIGFTLIFGVMRRLNLSYGPSIMLGVFAGTMIYIQLEAGLVFVACATVLGAVLAGIYVERICFWAVGRGAVLASMVSSFAIWMQLEELVTIFFPERTYAFPPLGDFSLEFGPFFIRGAHLVMFLCAVVLTVLLHLLLYKTRFGLALRAVSENPLAAKFMGINTGLVVFSAFALASAIGGVAGFLIASADQQITPLFGLWATFKGLIAMTLGGMGSIPGAIAGGLLLGIIEAQSTWYLGAEYRDLVAYFVLFAFLVFRPGGLFGQRLATRNRLSMQRV
ncbi:MAG: branched-chain amino acid ABC transporter permease [Hyphomicrobiaceae bacterium]